MPKIKELREKNNLTAVQLGELIGLNKAQMSYIETHKLNPTPKTMKQMCEVLQCEILDIYNKTELFYIDGKNASNNESNELGRRDFKKVTFRLNKGGYNLLKLAIKELDYKNMHELFRNEFLKPMQRKILRARKRNQEWQGVQGE